MNSKYENARLHVLQATSSFPPSFSLSLFEFYIACAERRRKREESKTRRIFDATPWRRIAREMI
jgi:hypothetical protein